MKYLLSVAVAAMCLSTELIYAAPHNCVIPLFEELPDIRGHAYTLVLMRQKNDYVGFMQGLLQEGDGAASSIENMLLSKNSRTDSVYQRFDVTRSNDKKLKIQQNGTLSLANTNGSGTLTFANPTCHSNVIEWTNATSIITLTSSIVDVVL